MINPIKLYTLTAHNKAYEPQVSMTIKMYAQRAAQLVTDDSIRRAMCDNLDALALPDSPASRYAYNQEIMRGFYFTIREEIV